LHFLRKIRKKYGKKLLPHPNIPEKDIFLPLKLALNWVCISYLVLRIAYRAGGLGLIGFVFRISYCVLRIALGDWV